MNSERLSLDRLPPGQQLAAPGKWPVVGERAPARDDRVWELTISGCVEAPCTWTLSQLRQMPQESRSIDIHCVTRWSMLGASFTGIRLSSLLAEVRPTSQAQFVSFVARSPREHSTSLPLADCLELGTFIALSFNGCPLPPEHGGPIRSVTPGRYFYKSVKWLTRIELLAEDRLGYWEAAAGYHNRADPWEEERFVASGISKQEAARILDQRHLAGQEFLGLDGSHRDLSGLEARGAVLRNANFRSARLEGAKFEGANLSNATFVDADLRAANLRKGDLEGANFIGCDLRGADLRGASLFGALFMDPTREGPAAEIPRRAAQLDATTRIDPEAIEALTPQQAEFIARFLRSAAGPLCSGVAPRLRSESRSDSATICAKKPPTPP